MSRPLRRPSLRRRALAIVASMILAASPVVAQDVAQDVVDVVVDVRGGTRDAPAYLNGYRESIAGAVLSYHSSHPDAADALLCRARRDAATISWRADSIPASFPGDAYRFVWLAGVERIGWGNPTGERTFHFLADGERLFTFTNRKDSTAPAWSVEGPGGATLAFQSSFTDRFGDLFGMMTLTVPKKRFRPGHAPVFSIESVDANAPEWVMVFTHPFDFTPRLRAEPAVLKSASGGAAPLRISLDNLVPGRRVRIAEGGKVLADTQLAVGGNVFLVGVSPSGGPRRLVYRAGADTLSVETFQPGPAPALEVWLIPHSHTDIGYTDLQPEVEKKHWASLDRALEIAERTKEYPEGSRFRWNLEVLWPFESYMAAATPGRRSEVIDAVKSGRIGLNALLVNPLTGLATAPGMDRYTEYARRFSEGTGIDIPTAAVSDIPGFTWGIVPSLARSGVRYFASAPNNGDRIGGVIEAQGDRPFWWESPSGKEKVLFWLAGASYSYFHEGTVASLGRDKMMKLLRKISDASYPYDMYYLPYTLGDNGGPDSTLPDFVREWNEAFETPKLVIGTHREMFEAFEKKYGRDLPVKRGDFTPYWEDGALSTANETAAARYAAISLLNASALWSMRAPGPWPAKEYSDGWRQMSLWDEHTWGADISVSDPDSSKTTGQWKIKDQYRIEAFRMGSVLAGNALVPPPAFRGTDHATPDGGITYYNTSSWPRSDVVVLPADASKRGDRVVDEKGRTLVSQRLNSGDLAILLEHIPAYSWTILHLEQGNARLPDEAGLTPAHASPGLLSNGSVSVRIDTSTGAITEVGWRGRSFPASGPGANRLLYVRGTDPNRAGFPANLTVRVEEAGPLVASVVATGEGPAGGPYYAMVRIVAGIDRVDLRTRFTKQSTREKEGVHIAFPFEVPGARFRYDVANAIVEADKDQLDGSCRNYSSVQSWVDVSNDSAGITWATMESPLVEMGGVNAESPWMRSNPPSSRFYSYVMNNYWHTNYKADQGGEFTFNYSLHPHGPFDPVASAKWGRERRSRLLGFVGARPEVLEPMPPLFTLSPARVIVGSVEPARDDGSLLVLLYNPSDTAAVVTIAGRDDDTLLLAPCDPSGRNASPAAESLTLAPRDSRYIVLRKDDQ